MAKVVGTADWRSRIGTEEGPTTMALGPQAFVQTRDPRYVSDAYQYFLNQGGGQDAAGIPATTVAQAPAASVTTGGGGETGITGASAAQNMGGGVNNVIPTTTAPFVETSPNVLAATNVPGTPIVPTRGGAQVIVDPRTGDTYAPGDYSDVAGTLADPREKMDYTQQDPTFWENARDKFVQTGQDVSGFFSDLKNKGIDVSKMAGSAIMNMVAPGAGLLMRAIPKETSEDVWNKQFAVGGEGFQDIAASDPGLGKRLEGYGRDLIAGTGEGKDPFGRNTISMFGDYEKRLAEDLQYTGDNQFNKDKQAYAQAYFDKKGIGLNPNEAKAFEEKYGISPTGAPVTRDRLIDEGIAAADEEDDMFEPTTVDQLEGVDPGFKSRLLRGGKGPGEISGVAGKTIVDPDTYMGSTVEGGLGLRGKIDRTQPTAPVTGVEGPPSILNPEIYQDPIMDIADDRRALQEELEDYRDPIMDMEPAESVDLGNPLGDPRIVSEEQGLAGDPWLGYQDPIMERAEESDKATVEEIADIADRQPEVIEQKKNELADIYDRQVDRGERDADPTTTSKVNKAKAVINMPQMLGDVGGSMDRDPAPSAPSAPTGISGPPGRGGSSGGPPSQGGGGGGNGGGGGGKIVCTMMNESYGFGSFRNKIWLRHSKDLAPEYQIGYHKIFLPLVRLSKTNKLLKKTLEHIAVHRTIDIRQEARGKVHLLGRVYRKILEPICYWVGKYAKR